MSEKFQNKYRIPSARLKGFDYSSDGAYFITICTAKRKHFFGEIVDGKMQLSNTGIIVEILWHDIKRHSKNVVLGEYIIMPNHMHGILILNDVAAVETLHATSDDNAETLHATSHDNAETLLATSVQNESEKEVKNQFMADISPKSNSISTIIRSYKSAVTKHSNRLKLPNGWQERFYDVIIRTEESFEYITNYIINNPAKWDEDGFYKNE